MMTYNYEILYFEPVMGSIGIQFDGQGAVDFRVPIRDGQYLTGADLDLCIRASYRHTWEERQALAASATNGADIQALAPAPTVINGPSGPSGPGA